MIWGYGADAHHRGNIALVLALLVKQLLAIVKPTQQDNVHELEVLQKRLRNSVSDVEMLQHVYRSLYH